MGGLGCHERILVKQCHQLCTQLSKKIYNVRASVLPQKTKKTICMNVVEVRVEFPLPPRKTQLVGKNSKSGCQACRSKSGKRSSADCDMASVGWSDYTLQRHHLTTYIPIVR